MKIQFSVSLFPVFRQNWTTSGMSLEKEGFGRDSAGTHDYPTSSELHSKLCKGVYIGGI